MNIKLRSKNKIPKLLANLYTIPLFRDLKIKMENTRYSDSGLFSYSHLEDNIWTHTMLCLHNYMQTINENNPGLLSVALGIIFHDTGKTITKPTIVDKHIIYHRHWARSANILREFMSNPKIINHIFKVKDFSNKMIIDFFTSIYKAVYFHHLKSNNAYPKEITDNIHNLLSVFDMYLIDSISYFDTVGRFKNKIYNYKKIFEIFDKNKFAKSYKENILPFIFSYKISPMNINYPHKYTLSNAEKYKTVNYIGAISIIFNVNLFSSYNNSRFTPKTFNMYNSISLQHNVNKTIKYMKNIIQNTERNIINIMLLDINMSSYSSFNNILYDVFYNIDDYNSYAELLYDSLPSMRDIKYEIRKCGCGIFLYPIKFPSIFETVKNMITPIIIYSNDDTIQFNILDIIPENSIKNKIAKMLLCGYVEIDKTTRNIITPLHLGIENNDNDVRVNFIDISLDKLIIWQYARENNLINDDVYTDMLEISIDSDNKKILVSINKLYFYLKEHNNKLPHTIDIDKELIVSMEISFIKNNNKVIFELSYEDFLKIKKDVLSKYSYIDLIDNLIKEIKPVIKSDKVKTLNVFGIQDMVVSLSEQISIYNYLTKTVNIGRINTIPYFKINTNPRLIYETLHVTYKNLKSYLPMWHDVIKYRVNKYYDKPCGTSKLDENRKVIYKTSSIEPFTYDENELKEKFYNTDMPILHMFNEIKNI